MNLIESVESEYMKEGFPEFAPGDMVRVNTKIREGEKERVQAYEGTVIRRSHGGLSETFTVRRVAFGEGSERTFPLHSPNIESIEVLRYGAVRRANYTTCAIAPEMRQECVNADVPQPKSDFAPRRRDLPIPIALRTVGGISRSRLH